MSAVLTRFGAMHRPSFFAVLRFRFEGALQQSAHLRYHEQRERIAETGLGGMI